MYGRKKVKRFLPLALSAACFLALAVPALAEEEIDPDRIGSVSVSIRAYATDDAVGGGSLNLYHIAETTVTESEGAAYHYTEAFSGCSDDLLGEDRITQAETANIFAEWVSENEIEAETVVEVSSDGKAYFADLSCGLYMITQETPAEGYNGINAFLVSVPIYEDGTWIYNVDATPKTSPVTKTEKQEPDKGEPDKGEPDKGEPDKGEPDKGEPDKGEPDKGEPGITQPGDQNPDGNGGDNGGTTSTNGGRTGDYNYLFVGAAVIIAALVIVLVLVRRRRYSHRAE